MSDDQFTNAYSRSKSIDIFASRNMSIGYNQLTSLPGIGKLINLEYLYIYSNQLISLPIEIGQLIKLRWIYVDNNHLTTLPIEIGRLINLQAVGLRRNRLTTLPYEIGQLVNLQALYLGGN